MYENTFCVISFIEGWQALARLGARDMSSVRVDSHQCCGLAAASSDPPSPVAAAAEVGSSSGTGAAGGCSPMPRVCGVRFGSVDVLYHSVHLDDSKLPSDGLAPLGLGELQRREHLQVDSFERQRCVPLVVPPASRISDNSRHCRYASGAGSAATAGRW